MLMYTSPLLEDLGHWSNRMIRLGLVSKSAVYGHCLPPSMPLLKAQCLHCKPSKVIRQVHSEHSIACLIMGFIEVLRLLQSLAYFSPLHINGLLAALLTVAIIHVI